MRAINPDEFYWFGQVQGPLVPRPLSSDGLYRSRTFPGLWLDPVALLRGDTQRLRGMVDRASAAEHAAFVARLAGRPSLITPPRGDRVSISGVNQG